MHFIEKELEEMKRKRLLSTKKITSMVSNSVIISGKKTLL